MDDVEHEHVLTLDAIEDDVVAGRKAPQSAA
jgi:hypothetical protein